MRKGFLRFLTFLLMMGAGLLFAQQGVPDIVLTPDTLDLGYRPNGAWMRPVGLKLYNNGAHTEIQNVLVSNSYFQIDLGDAVIPFSIDSLQSVDFTLTTGLSTPGTPVNANVTVNYGDGLETAAFVTAIPYAPVARDVWETAYQVTLPFTENLVNASIPLYNNYLLPGNSADGPDAVYKLVFTQDAYLNATVTGENGKVLLYNENFKGEDGPMESNCYTGPLNNDLGTPFEIQVGEGVETLGYFPFYTYYCNSVSENLFLANELHEAGMTRNLLTSLSWYATNQTGYLHSNISIWLANVDDTELTSTSHLTSNMTLVYTGAMTPMVGWNEFVFNENAFIWDGVSNLLICVQQNNYAWNSTVNWQTHTTDFTSYTYRYSDSEVYDMTGSVYSMNMLGSRANTVFKGLDCSAGETIDNLAVSAGTYYLVASSTSDTWSIEVNSETISCPEAAFHPVPSDYATNALPTSMDLKWRLGESATEYKLLVGTDYEALETVVDWTRDLAESHTLTNLANNTNYFWQVIERNDGCPEGVEGPIWGFTTTLNGPNGFYALNDLLYEGDELNLAWAEMEDPYILSYNIYQDEVLLGNTTETSFTVNGLTYNMEGYHFQVTAVYAGGESNPSEVTVYVTGNGTVTGHVYEQDGITPISDAGVVFSGHDEYNVANTYYFTSDTNGQFAGSLRAGSYTVLAESAGYQTKYYGAQVMITYDMLTEGVDLVMDELFNPVSVVYAEYSPDANNPNSPNVAVSWGTFSSVSSNLFDFDDGSMQGWTTIDADGDGYTWRMASEAMNGNTISGYNGSSDFVLSQSYTFNTGALNPDNYFVSPLMTLGGSISFWACAQDAGYAAEHFGVAVSTSSDTNPNAFTMLDEWTMTAKSGSDGPIGGKGSRDGNNRVQGTWYQYTVDLSAYHGMGYVAIRHFNCTDMFYLNVDDVVVNEPSRNMPDRSFSHYRVYRTNAYNNGPYHVENTTLIADNVTETSYIDNTWSDVETGVYKYGVSCVYAGNRESGISWGDMRQNKTPQVLMNREPIYPLEECSFGPSPVVNIPENTNLPILRGEYTECIIVLGGYDFGHFTLNNPAVVTSYGFSAGEFIQAACYIDGTYYFANGNGRFGTVDLTTGLTTIATDRPYGLIEFNPADGKLYGLSLGSNADLYEVNPLDGSYTWINSMASSYALAFTITGDGRFIICDAGDECIKEYDLETGSLTTLFAVDWNINYGQDMAMDLETGKVYWAACNATDGTHPLIELDLDTETLTIVGYFPDQASAFANETVPFDPIQGERESRIVWSNAIDKNMDLTDGDVNITVSLNSGDSPEGVRVSFTNLDANEQQAHPMSDVILDASGYHVWDIFRRGDYRVTVSFSDYETIVDEVSIRDATALNYTLSEINYGLSNLYVSRTGWASWTDNEHGNTTVPVLYTGDTFSIDFEEGIPAGWTVVDANNDGYTWLSIDRISEWGSNYVGGNYASWAHNGSNAALSSSYLNGIGVLYPDDYLVSPQVTIGPNSTISFWAVAVDATYAADHFGLAVSTGAIANPDDFVMVQEWTMTAKLGTWYQYNVDLSAYAGQRVYLAFRHFNCSDQYILSIDDVELSNGSSDKGNRHFNQYQVELCDASEVVLYQGATTDCYLQLPVEDLVDGERYHLKVAATYSSGLSNWSEVDWLYQSCDNFEGVTDLNMEMSESGNVISWTYPMVEERSILTGDYPAYACRYWNGDNSNNPTGWFSFDLDTPEINNLINPDPRFYGGDYCPLDGYVHSTNNNYNWIILDPETGEVLDQGSLDVYFRDCAWDYTTNTMYGITSDYLYRWDVVNNTVEEIGYTGVSMQVLACDLEGQLWTISNGDANLYKLDKTTGTSAYVGSTGRNCYYIQSGTFDHYSGKLYWAGCADDNGDYGFFAEVDTQTGATTVLLNNSGELMSLCVPFDGSDYSSPVTGVLGALVYRDGELLGFIRENQFVDTEATDDRMYEVRVVYDGQKRCPNFNSYYAMSCPTSIGGAIYEVNVTANPEAGGTVTGSGTYINGFTCTVTATENEGFVFANWTVDGEEVSTAPEYTFRVSGDTDIVANFIGYAPHWTVVDNPEYDSLSLIGVLQINGVEQGTNYLEVAAFSGDECRGRQLLTYYPELDRFLVPMTIKGQDNDLITFDVYDHLLGEETEFICLSDLTFVSGETIGSTDDPYIINFGIIPGTIMQTGWNWFAPTVEGDGTLEMLENSLGANGVMIKSHTDGFVMNYENNWVGNLESLSAEQMYMIKTNAPITAVLAGNQPDAASHAITIYPEWTWLGYPSANAMSINDALSGFTAMDGDVLKTKQSFSSYVDGQGWLGTLNTLNPGEGLMYHSMRNTSVTLTYSTQGGRSELAPNITAENNHWIPDAFEYPDNLSVMAVVELDGSEIADDNYELAVFAGNKCLGSAKLVFMEPMNRYVAFLTVSGEEGNDLRFGLYDSNTGQEYLSDTDAETFTPNAVIGSLKEPRVVRFTEKDQINHELALKLYPNPVNRGAQFSLGFSSGKVGSMTVEIVDALGATVSAMQSSRMPASIAAPATAGVYMIKVCVDGKETYCRKLIVK